jgi:hypothetical protein
MTMTDDPRPMPEIPAHEPKSAEQEPVREPTRGPAVEEPEKPRRAGRAALALGIAVGWLAAGATLPARADDCRDEIDRLARQLDLPTRPPSASAGTGLDRQLLTDKLAQSGGVIQPTDRSAGITIEPPRDAAPMQTAPKMPPQSGSLGQGSKPGGAQDSGAGDATTATAADRLRLEALLQAARSASDRGDSAGCLDRLNEAKGLGFPGRG